MSTGTEMEWTTHRIEIDRDPLELLGQEWLLTNGTGAYAMGTLPGANTRRYHGLLVAASHPPVGRVLVINQMLERIYLENGSQEGPIEFTTCLFRGPDQQMVTAPQGHARLRRFEKGLACRWVYQAGAIEFVRELSLPWQSQGAILRYWVRNLPCPATMVVSPMVTLRDFHGLANSRAFGSPRGRVGSHDRSLTLTRDRYAVTIRADKGGFHFLTDTDPWWYDVFYPRESERGMDDREDFYVPGGFHVGLQPNTEQTMTLSIALGEEEAAAKPESVKRRLDHLKPMTEALSGFVKPEEDADPRMLAEAADDFIVHRSVRGNQLKTILAGYPWFADWGRDTFISLPGLLLATKRYSEARDTLRAFAQMIHHGLIPNRFDDYDQDAAHYNTVDASLWFINAAMQYIQASGDNAAWGDWLGAAVRRILDAYREGIEDGPIFMAADGLIAAGHLGSQLTWMDAKQGQIVFTPRHGKVVEINALWYHALLGAAERFAERQSNIAAQYNRLASKVEKAFLEKFWNEKTGHLNDHLWCDEGGQWHPDETLRPNQVLAVSLPVSPLPKDKQQKVLQVVKDKLLTPYGLRTLPQDDPAYHGRCIGTPYERDGAYHQGTVWPWLIGPYAEAVLRVGGFSSEAKHEALEAIKPLLEAMKGPQLGQLHEIHDGDEPYTPRGCIAQAWSVAEVIRVLQLVRQGQAGQGQPNAKQNGGKRSSSAASASRPKSGGAGSK